MASDQNLVAKNRRYSWKAPCYAVDDEVYFLTHRRNRKLGRIVSIETKYRNDGVAWHSYGIVRVGVKTREYHTEDDIDGVAERVFPTTQQQGAGGDER